MQVDQHDCVCPCNLRVLVFRRRRPEPVDPHVGQELIQLIVELHAEQRLVGRDCTVHVLVGELPLLDVPTLHGIHFDDAAVLGERFDLVASVGQHARQPTAAAVGRDAKPADCEAPTRWAAELAVRLCGLGWDCFASNQVDGVGDDAEVATSLGQMSRLT